MKHPFRRRSSRRPMVTVALVFGALLLALPLVPSVRRYALMESM